jgi:hypothetical protein
MRACSHGVAPGVPMRACSHGVAIAYPPDLLRRPLPPRPAGRVSSRGRMKGLLAFHGHGLRGHPPARPPCAASYPVLVHTLAGLLHTAFRPRLATTPLCFANPSPPSGWVEDSHLQAVEHARHTDRIKGLLAFDGRSGSSRGSQPDPTGEPLVATVSYTTSGDMISGKSSPFSQTCEEFLAPDLAGPSRTLIQKRWYTYDLGEKRCTERYRNPDKVAWDATAGRRCAAICNNLS